MDRDEPEHNDDDDGQEEADRQVIERSLQALGCRFDAVTIFVSRHRPDGNTVSAWRGVGNWFARYGQVREWLIKQDAEADVEARRDMDD